MPEETVETVDLGAESLDSVSPDEDLFYIFEEPAPISVPRQAPIQVPQAPKQQHRTVEVPTQRPYSSPPMRREAREDRQSLRPGGNGKRSAGVCIKVVYARESMTHPKSAICVCNRSLQYTLL